MNAELDKLLDDLYCEGESSTRIVGQKEAEEAEATVKAIRAKIHALSAPLRTVEQPEDMVLVPRELVEQAIEATRRHKEGFAPMRIPVNQADSDVVHSKLSMLLAAHPTSGGAMRDAECVCKGNWRLILKECQTLIGKDFKDGTGKIFRFYGLVHGEDDYYYGMYNQAESRLLSCVGSIESHGFELLHATLSGKPGKGTI